MQQSVTLRISLMGVLAVMITRKVLLGHWAMKFVTDCKHQVSEERLLADENFIKLAAGLPSPTLILILNRHALNMTFNWLCNTAHMPMVHESTTIVALDPETIASVTKHWPTIRILPFIVDCLQQPFNYGEGAYQLFYLFRANLAASLLRLNHSFWMIQQDTYWRENLLALNVSDGHDADIIFDRADETMTLIAGGYYQANPTANAQRYFTDLADELSRWYAPDNVMMTSHCTKSFISCGYIPFNLIANWKWLHTRHELATIPFLVQFDGDTKLGGKLNKMRSLGFYFLNDDGVTCNESAVEMAKRSIEMSNSTTTERTHKSWSHAQFGFYQGLLEVFMRYWPLNMLMETIVLPYGHYLMLTL